MAIAYLNGARLQAILTPLKANLPTAGCLTPQKGDLYYRTASNPNKIEKTKASSRVSCTVRVMGPMGIGMNTKVEVHAY